jgi:hypothetical protein
MPNWEPNFVPGRRAKQEYCDCPHCEYERKQERERNRVEHKPTGRNLLGLVDAMPTHYEKDRTDID